MTKKECSPRQELNKKDNAKPTFLKFKLGGTKTNIKILDSVYSQNYKNMWDTPPTKQLDFGHSESGLLDISDLAEGACPW